MPDKVIRDTLLTANAVLALDGVHTTTEGLKLMRRRSVAVGALAAATALLVSACGGSSGSSSGGGGASTALEGVGPITLVQGKDTSNFVQGQLDKWNQQHPDQKVTLIELPEDADAQRQQMIQNANAKSDAYTVLAVDNVWTAEFAANRYIVELPTDQFPNTAEFLPPVIDSAKYKDKLYAVPYASDGGMLYYRTDLLQAAGIAAAPKTWPEMIDDCKKIQATPQGAGLNCYAGQFQKYEGLTVNAAEAINSAGGVITDTDGKPNVNTPEAKAGLDFLADGFKQGYIPKEALTYKEEESRRAFQEGKLIFLRNWPYVYALANETDGSSQVAGKFAVAPLPGLNGPGVSSLGGHALAHLHLRQEQEDGGWTSSSSTPARKPTRRRCSRRRWLRCGRRSTTTRRCRSNCRTSPPSRRRSSARRPARRSSATATPRWPSRTRPTARCRAR